MDVPNATVMIIENAERFGLSQLHQLRGRVGRSDCQSYCFLYSSKDIRRLKAMEKYYNGLKLSEIDLKIRGPGEIFGTKQHGDLELKIADFSDIALIEITRREAIKLVERDPSLANYPLLFEKVKPLLTKQVQPD